MPVSRPGGIVRNGGNNVAIDAEMSELLKNALTAQVLNQLLARKYGGLEKAISLRV